MININNKFLSSFSNFVNHKKILLLSKNEYSSTSYVLINIIILVKSKLVTVASSSYFTTTAFSSNINIWTYMSAVIKGTITDLTASLLWKFILYFCGIFLVGYGIVSIHNHAVEIYQIVQVYKQIVGSPELVALLNMKFELLNHFNTESAVKISKLTFDTLDYEDCQIIVKFCIYNSEYSFHGILMDISNLNMI